MRDIISILQMSQIRETKWLKETKAHLHAPQEQWAGIGPGQSDSAQASTLGSAASFLARSSSNSRPTKETKAISYDTYAKNSCVPKIDSLDTIG